MCLIIVKKKGVAATPEMYKAIARSYNLRNRDGFGFALKRGTNIYISKGYFNLKEFIKKIKIFNPLPTDELMIHLRKVSAGDRNIVNCHPYVCSSVKDELLQEEGYVKKPVICHNGTFHKHKVHNDELSDTYYFVKDFLGIEGMPYVLGWLGKKHKESLPLMLAHNQSRLSIMFPDKNLNILMIGDWEYDSKSQLYFSNDSYKKQKVTTIHYAYYDNTSNGKHVVDNNVDKEYYDIFSRCGKPHVNYD